MTNPCFALGCQFMNGCGHDQRGSGRCALLGYLLFILSFLLLWGFMSGNVNDAWSGEIEGQLLRATSGGKVPLADMDLNIVEDVPGIPVCKITPETNSIVVTTNAQGIFRSGPLKKAGLYHICAEFDYEAGHDFSRRLTAVVATPVYALRIGMTKVTIIK